LQKTCKNLFIADFGDHKIFYLGRYSKNKNIIPQKCLQTLEITNFILLEEVTKKLWAFKNGKKRKMHVGGFIYGVNIYFFLKKDPD
jgi:hypothetical protein